MAISKLSVEEIAEAIKSLPLSEKFKLRQLVSEFVEFDWQSEFRETVESIRDDVKKAGGISSERIDSLIEDYRREERKKLETEGCN